MKGKVISDVVYDKRKSEYGIKINGTEEPSEYTVVSQGIKAVKDYLFIRPGQTVSVEGQMEGTKIYSDKSRIELNEL